MKLSFNVRNSEYIEAVDIIARTFKVLHRSPVTRVRSPADSLLFILREWAKLLPELERVPK